MMWRIILGTFAAAALAALGGIGAVIALILYRKSQARYPEPDTLIIEPDVDAAVERLPDGRLTIRWGWPGKARIYAGTNPDSTDFSNPLLQATSPVTVDDPAPGQRVYFTIVAENGQRLVAAERVLPLQGAINLRDIGGYRTADGKYTRWGRVYRSGSLNELTDADQRYLSALGLRLVCDMRTPRETSRNPNHLPEGIPYRPLPVFGNNDASGKMSFERTMLNLHRLEALMLEAYTHSMVGEKGHVFGEALRSVSDGLPAIVHCTAGKDRTGIFIALLLHILGVPEETIVADYTLTNRVYPKLMERIRKDFEPLTRIGIQAEDLKPLLSANAATMRDTLAYIRNRYGSIDAYLRDQCGVDDTLRERLRAELLL
jgi:protein-tyrosine phosphatase